MSDHYPNNAESASRLTNRRWSQRNSTGQTTDASPPQRTVESEEVDVAEEPSVTGQTITHEKHVHTWSVDEPDA
jgi:hypothetical protein